MDRSKHKSSYQKIVLTKNQLAKKHRDKISNLSLDLYYNDMLLQ